MQNKTFYIDGFRAMVSLGALNGQKNCPYSCAFCYMQDGFGKYPSVEISDIINFLAANKNKFNIIYISGDTDSFAPPRTEQGLLLLSQIARSFDCDLTFTTRTTFKPEHLEIIKEIAALKKSQGKSLIAGISISRYSNKNAYLEPAPIPTPDERIETLVNLKKTGATTLLALRPFLPVVGIDEYITILNKCAGYVDIVLGEPYYFKPDDSLSLKRVLGEGMPENYEKTKVSVDTNNGDWLAWNSPERENAIKEKCHEIGAIFSMHSENAINEYRKIP